MGKDLVDLTFYRGSSDEPWGFRLSGGKDYGQPLTISQVIHLLVSSKQRLTKSNKVGLKTKISLNLISY